MGSISLAVISALNNTGVLRATMAIGRSQREVATSLERLSTGKKINRAADNPAGLITTNDFKSRITEISAQLSNFDQEEAWLGAREGATSALSDLTNELRGLIVSAADRSTRTADELDALQLQVNSIVGAIDYVSNTSRFKGVQIIGGLNSATIGAGSAQAADGSAYTLNDLKTGGRLNLRTGDMEAADKLLSGATSFVSGDRATVGVRLRAIDAERGVLSTELTNLDSARSAIEDTDIAEETAKLVRSQTLEQAAIYVKAAAQEQQADSVLALLRDVKDVGKRV